VTALNAEEPGGGFVNEVWVDASTARVAAVEERLRRPPFDVLEVTSQQQLRTTLQDEPIARASLLVLEVAAAVALMLALVGLVLGIASELRDERGELFDLEAQGVGPSGLRRQVVLRALMVLGFGLAGAAGLAFALSFLVVRLVALTASATLPEPPLRFALPWTVVFVSLAAVLCLATVLVGGLAAYAFSGATPERQRGVGT
jgi:ABC-type antimicrobial peptide transport system permease subunit